MVTEAGAIKIMDFGIARVRGAEQMTVDGRLMGTPAYMPPEQVLGQEVDGRADLYAVGVVFYRMMTGALPFTAETAMGMLQQQILETPLPMHRHRPGLPDWCEPLVQRALAKSPADRFQTAEDFREALARAAGLPAAGDAAKTFAPAAGEGINDTLDLSRAEALPVAQAGPGAVPIARSKRLAWTYWTLAILCVGAAALAYVTRPQPVAQPALGAPPAPRSSEPEATKPEPEPTQPSAEAPAQPVAAAPGPDAAPVATTSGRQPDPAEPVRPSTAPRRPVYRASNAAEPLLVFETKTVVGTRKPREHDAQLVLAGGKITVTPEIDSEYPFYSIPYQSVVSITYSRGRDPMWNSPEGPAQVTRGGGTLGKLGIGVTRDWISLRTNTQDQFVAMRFDELLVRRILLALEERTGRRPELLAQPKDAR
jgi:hypothetical protein